MRTWSRILTAGVLTFFCCLLLLRYVPQNTTFQRIPSGAKRFGKIAAQKQNAYVPPRPAANGRNLKTSVDSGKYPTEEELKKLAPWDGRVYDNHVQPGSFGQSGDPGRENIHPDSTLLSQLQSYLDGNDTSFYCPELESLYDYTSRKSNNKMPLRDNWDRFYAEISTCSLFPDKSKVIDDLLHDMATLPVREAVIHSGGTQAKLVLTFDNGKKAMFKPLRYGIGYETNPNHFYFSDFERANAEIAAFHLDRLIGFRRTVPTVGREVDLHDIKSKAEKALHKTFFVSPAKNLCFVSKCDYYCETGFAICGRNNNKTYGSLQAYLPDKETLPRDRVKSPYRRSYSKRRQLADWQEDDDYCETKVKPRVPYATKPRRLLDLVDLHIFDFLQGNLDRHHYEAIDVFDDAVYFVHLDNGRGFGKPYEDDWGMDILAPLYQCCVIRPATLQMLLHFYAGPKHLSQAMRESLLNDPMAPVLTEPFFVALDRRVEIVLRKVAECIAKQNGDVRSIIRNEFTHPNPQKEEEEESE